MRTPKIIQTIQRTIKIRKYTNHENRIKRNFQVHDSDFYGNASSQMYQAREVIARYAVSKGVAVDIFDARRLYNQAENVSSATGNKPSDKMHVMVTNLLNGQSESRIVSANTDKVYPKVREHGVLIPVRGEQDQQTPYILTNYTEDTFLRNLYRNIEQMTNSLTKSK